MEKQAIIRRRGPIIDIGSMEGRSLPEPDVEALARQLVYTHRTFKHGRWHPGGGSHDRIDSAVVPLYDKDDYGRLRAYKGFYPRVRKILQSRGYQVAYLDRSRAAGVPPARPNRFQADWDAVLEKFHFRPLQDTCLTQIAAHPYGLIDAVTAFGKAYVIWMVAALYPKAKVDIITKAKDVAENLYRLGHRYVGSVGMRGGGKNIPGRVTVYLADSLHHSDFDADIVLCDEVHELCTPRYLELLVRYWDPRMFGFTASANTRFDGAHNQLEGIFGPTIFYLDYPTAERYGLVAPILVQWLDCQTAFNPVEGLSRSVEKKRRGIWQNDERNYLISRYAQQAVDSGLQTLLLVETVEHALRLRRFLPDFALCYSEQALSDSRKRNRFIREGILHPDEQMTPQRRSAMREAFERQEIQAAIATGVWSTGVSFDALQCLGRVDGGASETNSVQIPGRVGRVHQESGKEFGLLFDIDDRWDPGFARKSNERRLAYRRRGWTQLDHNGNQI